MNLNHETDKKMKTGHYLLIPLLMLLLFSCQKESVQSDTGTGGSMARFTIKGNYLYAVDFDNLHVFNINNPENVIYETEHYAGFGIETIFPFEDLLFLGARNGMHIYSIEDPAKPVKISFTPHFVSYDPVVVQEHFAYVTLRSDASFDNGRNLLQVYDISNLTNPILLKEYEMKGPRGLGIDGNQLFVCDDEIKIYTVSNGFELDLKTTLPIEALDVIPLDSILYVVASDGVYQYSYNETSVELISKLTVPYGQE